MTRTNPLPLATTKLALVVLATTLTTLSAAPAHATPMPVDADAAEGPPSPAPPPPPLPTVAPPAVAPERVLGVGYKIGNGLGFLGADLVVAPIDHLALDLQANYFSESESNGTAKGYGLAPSIQGRLFAGQVSTPYVGVGYVHAKLSLADVSASVSGFFVNAGYEWRWEMGLGILLGGGVSHLGNVHAGNGVDSVDFSGGTHFNIEAGLRYMFL